MAVAPCLAIKIAYNVIDARGEKFTKILREGVVELVAGDMDKSAIADVAFATKVVVANGGHCPPHIFGEFGEVFHLYLRRVQNLTKAYDGETLPIRVHHSHYLWVCVSGPSVVPVYLPTLISFVTRTRQSPFVAGGVASSRVVAVVRYSIIALAIPPRVW